MAFSPPYFKQAGKVATKKIGEALYQILKKRFRKKPATQEALTDLKKAPDAPDMQAVLRVQLKKFLVEDEAFATELQQLVTTQV